MLVLASTPLGYCSFQNILTNPIISQMDTLSYIISYYSSAITINSTTTTRKCTLHSVLFLNFFEEQIISILAFPGFEPTHPCDPSDQRRL